MKKNIPWLLGKTKCLFPLFFLLDAQKKPYPVEDSTKWAKEIESQQRIALDNINNVRVSTIFLGINHNFAPIGDPLLFETMIFDDKGNTWMGVQWRYSTYEEALKGHKAAIKIVNKSKGFLYEQTDN